MCEYHTQKTIVTPGYFVGVGPYAVCVFLFLGVVRSFFYPWLLSLGAQYAVYVPELSHVVAALVAILFVRVFTFQSKQLSEKEVQKIVAAADLDAEKRVMLQADAMAERLAGAIRFKTISYDESDTEHVADVSQMLGLHKFIDEQFPNVRKMLKKTVINKYSLVYHWEGSDATQKPYMLYAHTDVVPAPHPEKWSVDPFAGVIKDGFVWGRGAIDDKQNVMGFLEAIESLLLEGYRPRRSVYIALGHDEEVSGMEGAKLIGEWFEKTLGRNCFEYMLDEGLFIIDGVIPGHTKPVAMVCVAEKGYLTLKLSVSMAPGHASSPPKESTIGVLAGAVKRLEENPLPLHFEGVARNMFEHLAHGFSLPLRLIVSNFWLFGGLFKRILGSKPQTSTIVRTTTALTIFKAGEKSNVMPAEAYAVVNHRVHVADDIDTVIAYNKRVINDDRVKIEVMGQYTPASFVSSDSHAAFKGIRDTVLQVFKGTCAVVPSMFIAASDSKHFWNVAPQIYRFSPVALHASETAMFHGFNEKISIKNYSQIVLVARGLILGSDKRDCRK